MRRLVRALRLVPGPSGRSARLSVGGGSQTRTLPDDQPILRFRLAAILAAQLFDFATFTIMVERHGSRAELNPIVAAGFESGGLPVVLLIKLMLILLLGSTIVILGRRESTLQLPSRLAGFIALAAVFGGVIGGLSNAMSI